MENEKLTYINSRGERLELGVDSVYHCNISKDVEGIDELASLLWHTKYFDVGTFSLLAPITDNNSRLLVEGNLITKHDGKKEVKTADGGVWRRAAQITYVHITKDENGLEQLEAQGYMLSWWLNKRCIYPQIVATGTNQYLINLMVKNNCGSAAGTKRRFPLLTFLAQETIDGVAVEYANEVYAQLGQEVKARAQAGKLGYDILLKNNKDIAAKSACGTPQALILYAERQEI